MDEIRPPTTRHLLDVGLVGAGKVGLVIASALQGAGHRISAVWSPTSASIDRAEQLFGVVHRPESIADIAAKSDLVIIAVPDDAIVGVVERLAARPELWPGVTVIHVSGRYGADVLRPLLNAGAVTAAVYPAMAFTGAVSAEVERTRNAMFAITGDVAGTNAGRALVEQIGASYVEVAEADRPLFHAAIAHASNHLVTLVIQAGQMLQAVGVNETSAVLTPILTAALRNSLSKGPDGATGPVVRGDVGTIGAHLEALRRSLPAALPSYQVMSLAGADIASTAGRLPTASHERIRALIDGFDVASSTLSQAPAP